MFKQIKYKVVFREGENIITAPVRRLWINDMGAYQADIDRPQGDDSKDFIAVPIDFDKTFLQEATSKFDKNGIMIFSSDIIKSPKKDIEELKNREDIDEFIFFQIAYVDGAFVGMNMKFQVYIPLNESIARISERVGDVFLNSELVEVKPDETVFQEKKENE